MQANLQTLRESYKALDKKIGERTTHTGNDAGEDTRNIIEATALTYNVIDAVHALFPPNTTQIGKEYLGYTAISMPKVINGYNIVAPLTGGNPPLRELVFNIYQRTFDLVTEINGIYGNFINLWEQLTPEEKSDLGIQVVFSIGFNANSLNIMEYLTLGISNVAPRLGKNMEQVKRLYDISSSDMQNLIRSAIGKYFTERNPNKETSIP